MKLLRKNLMKHIDYLRDTYYLYYAASTAVNAQDYDSALNIMKT